MRVSCECHARCHTRCHTRLFDSFIKISNFIKIVNPRESEPHPTELSCHECHASGMRVSCECHTRCHTRLFDTFIENIIFSRFGDVLSQTSSSTPAPPRQTTNIIIIIISTIIIYFLCVLLRYRLYVHVYLY